jgi:flagella basal body P-ring formation protein FlgA
VDEAPSLSCPAGACARGVRPWHVAPRRARPGARPARLAAGGLLAAALAVAAAQAEPAAPMPGRPSPAVPASAAADGLDTAALREIETLGQAATAGLAGARVEVEAGRLDPRLKLAPCERVEASLPAGARAWGRTRVALRCLQGPVPWQVYLPVTVKVFAPAWVAAAALPAGTALEPSHLRPAEVDWAAERSPPLAEAGPALGRRLLRALAPGQALRQADLARQQWFAAGERVQLLARGTGFSVSGQGLALAPGIEGQPVRVRTDAGQVLSGIAVGTRRVEVAL